PQGASDLREPRGGARRRDPRPEADVDVEPALAARTHDDLRAVRRRDGLDDREAETEPFTVGAASAVEALEGLEQALELGGANERAAVRNGQHRDSPAGRGRDGDPAVGNVVSHGIADEVRHQSFDQRWVAGRLRRVELTLDEQVPRDRLDGIARD